jgi:transcriptional regulator with XRE-family HTH domain
MGHTYKSYSFIDKDPILDEVRTIIQSSGVTYAFIEHASGVTITTLHNWFSGPTKRPQAATINAVLQSLGHQLTISPSPQEKLLTTTPSLSSHKVRLLKQRLTWQRQR